MKRRSHSEIQTSDQIPANGKYDDWRSIDYSKLVPTYKHTSYKSCHTAESSESSEYITEDPGIYYNSRYKYGMYSDTDEETYSRDNYCVIPVSVPAMSLKAHTYNLDHNTVIGRVPKVSKNLNLDYDTSFLVPGNSLMIVSLAAADVSVHNTLLKFLSGHCSCDNTGKPNPCAGESCYDFIQPLDSISIILSDISDEYAYSWQDNWDMSVLTTVSTKKYRPPESSSSGTQTSGGSFVYLCKVTVPPTGAGGAAIVTINGSGGVTTGSTIAVNFPSI